MMGLFSAVFFEISNQCNLSGMHKKCPASLAKTPIYLPTFIIERVLAELSGMNFRGEICFHRYNEPTADARLINLIEMARVWFPENSVRILSNGTLITQDMKKEFDRLNVVLKVCGTADLDDRLKLYDSPVVMMHKPCYAMEELTISCEGDVVICCLDWKNVAVFGNLSDKTLEEIVCSNKYISARDRLKNGVRDIEPCGRCAWTRERAEI